MTAEHRNEMTDGTNSTAPTENSLPSADAELLARFGYQQELPRRLSGFSNYALSMSIICILAGGVTSFSQGLCSVGGAAIGIGWPLVCLFSLIVAATMGQIASAFPTAGGLYHWASLLGGRHWGWATAWFNLTGLIAVLAAINVGLVRFALGWFLGEVPEIWVGYGVLLVTVVQAMLNHVALRLTTRLTDFSGWWILGISLLLTGSLIVFAADYPWSRLVEFTNFSGAAGGHVWPENQNLWQLFLLGFLLPAYTLTGFDASAHVSEETVAAAEQVPRSIIRAVIVSGLAGWIMLVSVVLAIPDLPVAASKGEQAFVWTIQSVLPRPIAMLLMAGIVLAQFLCGLATVMSASRMVYAFARDGGLPFSSRLRHVCPVRQTPVWGIWSIALSASLLAILVPYSTIAAVCAVLLYISYVIPTALGFWRHGREWTQMGPWHLGRAYRPLAAVAVLGTLGLLIIGVQPPNDQAIWIVRGLVVWLILQWVVWTQYRFKGPPLSADMLTQSPSFANPSAKVASPAQSSLSKED